MSTRKLTLLWVLFSPVGGPLCVFFGEWGRKSFLNSPQRLKFKKMSY